MWVIPRQIANFFNRWPEKATLTLFVFVLATDKDMYFVAGVLMSLSLVHGGAAPQFLSKRMYQWISQGYSDVRSTVELADVLPGTEIYTQLHGINDSRDMTDSQLGLDDMCGFLEVAGCTFPVRELTDKNKIISACVQFHLVDRVHSCMERYVVNNSLTCLHAVCLQDKMKTE